MKSNHQNTAYYPFFLTKKEILEIGTEIINFEKRQIDFNQLKANLLAKGIEITAQLRDVEKIKMTVTKAEELKIRISKGNLLPHDINYYLISNNKYKSIILRHDRYMIEVLAEAGNKEEQARLEAIKEWERRHTPFHLKTKRK